VNIITNADDVARIVTLFERERRNHLLIRLRELGKGGDQEINHALADQALLDYIDDPEISAAFDAVEKWYA
jgi:hypothetical protein